MDLILCLLILPLALPLMGLLALLIRLDSPGSALFIQKRVGRDKQAFQMYKFRTLVHDCDDSSHRAFMKAFVNGQIGGDADENAWHQTDCRSHGIAFAKAFVDPRTDNNGNGKGKVYKPFLAPQVTRMGCILRKSGLDELPQIFNVLKGDMSLVGPRPNVPWEVDEYQSWHYERLEVLPGITGLAQVMGRSSIKFDTIVRYDIEYVERQSLAMDLKVLWWTLSTVLSGKGAS
jgi:lipopolysaccharide/colanic/teichoic acid biosynthesis glycosyltransferase